MGRSYDVAAAAADTAPHVSEIHSISGSYDLLVKCTLDDTEDIGRYVTSSIQTLPGVRDTFTLIAFNSFS